MAEDALPPEARRRGVSGGTFAVGVLVVAILMFLAGFYVGQIYAPTKPPAELPALVIGTNTPFPPFEYRDDNDNIVGFDIDLIKEVAKRMDRAYEIVNFRDFGALLAAVSGGTVDIAASAITSSGSTGATRNATMDFSDAYYESDQGLLVQASNAANICGNDGCTGDDIQGLRVGAQSGTTSEYWVYDNVPDGGANMTTYPDVTLVLQALRSGAIDVIVIDRPAADGIVATNPSDYRVAGTVETNELYSFAVANNDPDGLLPGMNSALAAMRSDGTYQTIVDRWF